MTPRQKRILAAIESLETREGTVTPRALWESAQDESHPLHNEFEWDDSVAAAAHRDEQARKLLRVRITITHEERIISAPICVRTPEADAGTASYTRTTSILSDIDRSRKVLLEEIARARRAVERAKDVADALGLGDECDTLIGQLDRLQSAAE